MGKAFRNMFKGIKLAFKTVTFHWKQYVCFFLAMLAMQVMFGIIVMSSSKSQVQYQETAESSYSYHFAITNLPDGQRSRIEQRVNSSVTSQYIVTSDDAFLYVTINEESKENTSFKNSYKKFVNEYLTAKNTGDIKPDEMDIVFTPRYDIQSKKVEFAIECAVKLLVLAAVAILVIILLYNIRLNHFKFTYGIYMSYGAGTKKLFFTCFWDMLVIGIITFIPAALISIGLTFWFFAPEGGVAAGQFLDFLKNQAPLVFFGLLFLIPVCIIAIIIPIKIIASSPPLKLLIAQDNSNYVSSPRLSAQLMGKKFPGSYQRLGLFRFRRYVATVVASSVLFSAIFVWISFFSTIYSSNAEQERAEFTVEVDMSDLIVEVKEYIPNTSKKKDVTDDFKNLRNKIYQEHFLTTKISDVKIFESFYTSEYVISRYTAENNYNGKVYENKIKSVKRRDTGENVTDYYWEIREKVVRNGYWQGASGEYGNSTFMQFEEYLTNGFKYDGTNKTNNPNVKYYQELDPVTGIIGKVYEKEYRITPDFPEANRQKIKEKETLLEDILTQYTLYKEIDAKLIYKEDSTLNYVYAAFNSDNVKAFSGYKYNSQLDKRVTTKIDIRYLDSGTAFNADFLTKKYDIEFMDGVDTIDVVGMTSVGNTRYVIISETAANSQVLNIKPGDKITLGFASGFTESYDPLLDADALLSDRIEKEHDKFTEREYIVYGVIKNMPTSSSLPIYVIENEYKEVTGINSPANKFSVYLSPNVESTTITALHSELAEWAKGYASVNWNNAVAQSREIIDLRSLSVVKTIAVFALLLSPLFWFFSQIMFYGKREEEFRMLRNLGATESQIKKIFRKDALVFMLLGVVLTVILSLIGIFAIYRLNLLYVAFFDSGAINLYRFKMPWISLGISVAVSAFCGFISTLIPYRIDRRKAKKSNAREFGV